MCHISAAYSRRYSVFQIERRDRASRFSAYENRNFIYSFEHDSLILISVKILKILNNLVVKFSVRAMLRGIG
jgi:hypothetical protein